MALQSAYKQFLAAPNPALLASNPSLHYITTLLTFNGHSDIIKHLNSQQNQLTKKEETFLNVVESQSSLAVEVHTTIEFKTGGGSYLPGLDDNFLADRLVTLPIIHMVNFEAGKVQQVRQSWDQGSLLKLIDVIGKTGRNWPIRDGKDQIKLITSSIKSAGTVTASEEQPTTRSRTNTNNVTRDPHASLALFAPREETYKDATPAAMAHRSSAKPPPRDYHDLFVGNESDNMPTATFTRDQSESPSKNAIAKGGAGKNYLPSRLFDMSEDPGSTPEKLNGGEKYYKPNAARYQHFDLGAGDDAKPRAASSIKSKHDSQWNFDDFSTPAAKNVPTKGLRANDVRHWGNSEDEAMNSPIHLKKVDKPRRDAETHFEFQDDGTPNERRIVGRPRGAGQNNGLGLYRNNVYDEEDKVDITTEPKVTTNPINIKDRHNDFDPHFTLTDESPSSKPSQGPLAEDRAKAVKMMNANWTSYDNSPKQKENVAASQSATNPTMGNGKGPLSESTNVTSNRNENKGISVGGDGMGGKKGVGRSWGFGDDSEGDATPNKPRPGKKQTKLGTGGDFWDF